MSEKEKMLTGLWYDANFNQELLDERQRADDLCFAINQTKPSDLNKRKQLFKQLIPDCDDSVEIKTYFTCDYGTYIHIEANCFINRNCYFMDGGGIYLGKNVFMGPNCGLYTAIHPLDYAARNKGLELAKPITIKDNVWIGGNVTILPGVTIGSGSVIGAGSVVTKDIPENVVAIGNPCKVLKKIEQQD